MNKKIKKPKPEDDTNKQLKSVSYTSRENVCEFVNTTAGIELVDIVFSNIGYTLFYWQ